MKAFVSGSTGLLGSNLVALLLEGGHEVVALARSPQKAAAQLPASDRLRIVTGDMENIGGFAAQMSGCDVLFHTAAYFREYYGAGAHWDKLNAINVKGTRRMLDEAERHGFKKVIYVSSSGVIGQRADGAPSDESNLLDIETEANRDNLYFKSKVLAEREVLDWLTTHSLPVVMILPTWMYGPQDSAPTAGGQIVLDVLNKTLPAIPPGGSSVVDARDVATAMISAVENGRSGERYVVSGSNQTLWDIAQTIGKVSGVPAPRTRIPYPVALAVAWVSQTVAELRGTESLMSVSGVRLMKRGLAVTDAKARRELGHRPRPFEATLRDTVRWYQQHQPKRIIRTTAPI